MKGNRDTKRHCAVCGECVSRHTSNKNAYSDIPICQNDAGRVSGLIHRKGWTRLQAVLYLKAHPR